jgi:hypothetical protein
MGPPLDASPHPLFEHLLRGSWGWQPKNFLEVQ